MTPEQAELIAKTVMTGENGSITADRLLIDTQGDVSVKTTVGSLDARSETGSIEVVETDSIAIDRLEAARGARVVAGDAITIVSLVTPEQAELIAKSVLTGEGGSITADRLLIDAQDNVSVKTTVGTLDARSQTGSIEVVETDSLEVFSLVTPGKGGVYADSDIRFDVLRGDEVEIISYHGNVMLDAASNVTGSVIRIEDEKGERIIHQYFVDSRAFTDSDYFQIDMDSNADGFVSPLDVLVLIDKLNSYYWHQYPASYDIDKDGSLTALDVLQVINFLNEPHEFLSIGPVFNLTFFDFNNDGIIDTVINGSNHERLVGLVFSGFFGKLIATF